MSKQFPAYTADDLTRAHSMGMVTVSYNGCVAETPASEFAAAVENFRNDPEARERVFKAAIDALDKTIAKIRRGEKITERERANMAGDIAIYAAYQVAVNDAQPISDAEFISMLRRQ